jgi:hypothetical protein
MTDFGVLLLLAQAHRQEGGEDIVRSLSYLYNAATGAPHDLRLSDARPER